MNTFLAQAHPRRAGASWLLAGLVLLLVPRAQATLPEPDHVVYGMIAFGTNLVTAQSTNVVVELRRTPSGPTLAAYRMGENPGFGDSYAINVPLESLDPASTVNPGLIDTNAALPGHTLVLLVRDRLTLRYQTNFVVGAGGTLQRIDFGWNETSVSPVDQWQQFHFGQTGRNMNSSPTGKPQTLQMDYIAGTNPNDTNSLFRVHIAWNGGSEVSFLGLRAEGPGYAGLTRRYSLEHSTNLLAGSWTGVPGYTNLLGNNQTILYTAPTNSLQGRFYRAQVWLQAP